jgi:hypothetical protein
VCSVGRCGLGSCTCGVGQHVIPHAKSWLRDWWTGAHKQIMKPHRRVFDSLVLLTSRMIWLERNGRVFNMTLSLPDTLARLILVAIHDWCRAKLFGVGYLGRVDFR